MSIAFRALSFFRSRLGECRPALRLRLWTGEHVDLGDAPVATITLRSPSVLRALLSGDLKALGDAYVHGLLTVDGAIEDIVDAGIALADRLGGSRAAKAMMRLRRSLPRRRTLAADAADVRRHYDVSNDFYSLWLDERMIYSCAYFRSGTEDIDCAQEQKLEHICRKLRLQPGERLLDVGCGWGGLPIYAARRYGVRCVGVTLSAAQHAHARERIAREALDGQVAVRLGHYRELDESEGFDKIVSVGMYEHVGVENLPVYFKTIERLLRPGGAFLNHGVVATDARGDGHGPDFGDFIQRHVFPGGSIAHLSRTVFEIGDAGLELADVEDLRPHYARTLRCWSQRLESREEAAIAYAGADRFRIWRAYLAGMACAFERGWLSVAQALAYKRSADGRPAARPWTREHQYGGGGAPSPAYLSSMREEQLRCNAAAPAEFNHEV